MMAFRDELALVLADHDGDPPEVVADRVLELVVSRTGPAVGRAWDAGFRTALTVIPGGLADD